MTIASEISQLETNLSDIKNSITTQGGTVEEGAGLNDIASAIETIEGGGSAPVGDYGKVTYYIKEVFVVEDVMAMGCQAEVVDADKVGKYAEDGDLMLMYEDRIWNVGWEGEIQFTTEELETEVGVLVTDIEDSFCEVNIRGSKGIDKSAGEKQCSLDSLEDFEAFFKSSGIVLPNGDEINSTQVSQFILGSEVTEIGNNFLAGSHNLVSFDGSLANNLTIIGHGFLDGSSKLKDAIRLESVTEVGNAFLRGSSVADVTMPSLDTVGSSFCQSSSISGIAGLTKLRVVGGDFCSYSRIMYAGFPSTIETIGNSALAGCSNLTNIQMFNVNNLISIGHGFASGCANLDTINFPSNRDISTCFPQSSSDNAFSSSNQKSLTYLYGIFASGTSAQIKAKYPDTSSSGSSSGYRKWRS